MRHFRTDPSLSGEPSRGVFSTNRSLGEFLTDRGRFNFSSVQTESVGNLPEGWPGQKTKGVNELKLNLCAGVGERHMLLQNAAVHHDLQTGGACTCGGRWIRHS